MTWTTPKTWQTEPLTSTDMNTHIRDNLNALKAPPTAKTSMGSLITITAPSFADVTGTTVTITTTGGDLMVGFTGYLHAAAGYYAELVVRVDSTDYYVALVEDVIKVPVGGVVLVDGLAATTHTIRFRARVTGGIGGVRLYQIWAREVS